MNRPPAAHPPSYYAATANDATRHARLAGDVRADVCVIGGGFTGVSSALCLAERGYRVVLLEAERIGWGASGRNGGQAGSGQRRGQTELERIVGRDRARAMWDLAEAAKAEVKDRIARHAIACDWKPGIMNVAHKRRYTAELHEEADWLARQYDCTYLQPLSPTEVAERLGARGYHGGVLDSDAGHLHPLNFALGLARAAVEAGAVLHEESAVIAIRREGGRHVVATAGGTVSADNVVVACNGYLGDLMPPLAGRIMPINNFIATTAPLDEAAARALIRDDVAVADTRFVVYYYRLTADRRMLFGGGETYRRTFPDDIAGLVRRHLTQVFPQLTDAPLSHAWGGTLAVTARRMPVFGRTPDGLYYALGYSGHGVALSTLAGRLIAEAVAGAAERFDVMADFPQPRFPGGTLLRWPLMASAMLWYSLRDRV